MALHRRQFLYGILSVPAGGLLARGPRAGLTATVYNGFELDAALAAAGPGSAITLAPGSYGDIGRFVLASSGVSVRVQSPLETVLHAPLVVEGHASSLEGLTFQQGIHLIGNGLSLVNNRFVGGGVEITGVNVEVGYCEITGFRGRGVIVRGTARTPYIHHNYFHDSVGKSGTGEAIAVGLSMNDTDRPIAATIEYNLFQRANGDDEVVGIKSSGNTFRFNTMLDCMGYVSNRHGTNNSYIGNTCIHSGGFVIHDEGNRLLGNRTMSSMIKKGIIVMGGNVPAGSNAAGQWPQAVDTYLCGNQTDGLVIGYNYAGQRLPAVNTTVAGHMGSIALKNEVGTDLNGVPVSVPSAVQVGPADVGPRAPNGNGGGVVTANAARTARA